MRTSRRAVLVRLACLVGLAGMGGGAAALATGCMRGSHTADVPVRPASPPLPMARPKAASGEVELWSWFDLPVEPRSRELSGLAWDERQRILWAVQDHRPAIVALVPDPELRTWKLGEEVMLDVPKEKGLDL